MSLAIPSVEDILPLSEDDFVVAASPLARPTVVEITRVRLNHEEAIASTPALFPSDPRALLFPKAAGWWLSRQGTVGSVSSVFFVVSDEAVHQTRVKSPRQFPLVWLPIRGDEPRGVQVSIATEQPALLLDEVTPSGVRPMGAFAWWETGFKRTVMSSRWSAERLGGGRFAVVSVDGPAEGMNLRLRVVGGGEAVESALPCAVAIDHPLATAVDGSGRVAVVGLSKAHEVVALIVDVDRPELARCRVISTAGKTAARLPVGTPSVVWTGEGFVTAWIGDDGSVRACELGSLRAPSVIVDIGRGADVERQLRQLLHSDTEQVIFIWKESGGGFVQRRMPRNLNGYALAADLWRFFCAACPLLEQTGPSSDASRRRRP